ncbi:hypothetical protein [Pontiella desulfatans]|uniref:hypothetical protein n=1 Tax=Pontiella desulfatans TaxID=2750659 RepID=UPI00109C5885|nr:hypothetical protein [Pontiella desulfatans]
MDWPQKSTRSTKTFPTGALVLLVPLRGNPMLAMVDSEVLLGLFSVPLYSSEWASVEVNAKTTMRNLKQRRRAHFEGHSRFRISGGMHKPGNVNEPQMNLARHCRNPIV